MELFSSNYNVQLEVFEGPLDLLLHLINKNEVEIKDIQIAEITKQYLEYINFLKELNLDIAGEFLVMASTLLHIKSKMLLPIDEEDEDEEDPREELVKKLLEYKQYKEAAMVLNSRAVLGREVFTRKFEEEEVLEEEIEADLFELVAAFRQLLEKIPTETFHDVIATSRFSVADSINEILNKLEYSKLSKLTDFVENGDKEKIIVTFLAILELCKLKVIKVYQNKKLGEIWISLAVD